MIDVAIKDKYQEKLYLKQHFKKVLFANKNISKNQFGKIT